MKTFYFLILTFWVCLLSMLVTTERLPDNFVVDDTSVKVDGDTQTFSSIEKFMENEKLLEQAKRDKFDKLVDEKIASEERLKILSSIIVILALVASILSTGKLMYLTVSLGAITSSIIECFIGGLSLFVILMMLLCVVNIYLSFNKVRELDRDWDKDFRGKFKK
ncbi:hypothetical protein N480_25735 [Pseudoalteromonas luteoviolacea S2607]|nr:hypothetical protein N480_25735 [Pseudoalteromonas luteoviolacea S2607]